MAEIVLTNVVKRWGQFYAVDNLNLKIEDNAFVTLLGPSGCGKTTTLRMIAGLETPTSGRITIDGVPVFDSEMGINVPANSRKVGFLFQNYALWPNMTVYQNISFGLSNIKEELPDTDFEAKNAARLRKILEKPEDVAAMISESSGKDGKPDAAKALLRLMDTFEISQYTAKTLMGYDLGKAPEIVKRLEGVLAARQEKHAAAGLSLNESFEIAKNGAVQKSVRKLTKEEIDLIVRRVARIVKIGMFMDRYPSELSGGQQQRVAIARTLAPGPKVLFMDEPLSNLDAKLRLEMRSELQRLHLNTGSTFIYVTHDQLEAMTLATKICLMDNGVLQQYDEPMTLYNRPGNLFAADFVGNPAINFIEASGRQQPDGTLSLSLLGGLQASFHPLDGIDIAKWYDLVNQEEKDRRAAEDAVRKGAKGVEKGNKDTAFKYRIAKVDEDAFESDAPVTEEDFVLGVRPEFLRIREDGVMEAEVFSAMPTGMETTVRLRIGRYLLTGVVFGGVLYKIGQKIRLDFLEGNILLFSRKNGLAIAQGTLHIL